MKNLQNYDTLCDILQQFGISNVTFINNVESLKKKLFDFENAQSNGTQYFWRGLNDASFKLYAKSQIDYDNSGLSNKEVTYKDYLQRIIEGSCSMYPHYFSQNVGGANQDLAYTLGRLSLIQHYASGTPLIDFTSSMWVGLFFAWKGAKVVQHSSNCCARNYIQLNYFEYNLSKENDAQIDATGNTKEIPLQCIFEYKNGEDKNSIHDIMHCPSNIIFFADSIREYNYKGQLVNEANISNSRLKAQYGFFVIHTEETECLERKWFQLAKDVFPLRKILIHKSLLDNVEELLQEKFGPDMEKYLLPYFEDNVKQIIIDAQK